jgi:hypothetical protein
MRQTQTLINLSALFLYLNKFASVELTYNLLNNHTGFITDYFYPHLALEIQRSYMKFYVNKKPLDSCLYGRVSSIDRISIQYFQNILFDATVQYKENVCPFAFINVYLNLVCFFMNQVILQGFNYNLYVNLMQPIVFESTSSLIIAISVQLKSRQLVQFWAHVKKK